MKVFTAAQMRDWDAATMRVRNISSLELMETAASACVRYLLSSYSSPKNIVVLCGTGNNGGDGLAIARKLQAEKWNVKIVLTGQTGTEDFNTNLERCSHIPAMSLTDIDESVFDNCILLDALFGTGLSRPLEGRLKDVVENINKKNLQIISVDLPSGLFSDHSSRESTKIRATTTLTFQALKPALLMAENAEWFGETKVLDIGLDQSFSETTEAFAELVDQGFAQRIYQPRKKFAHKGNFGHALLLAGSKGKMGAAVLAANACLRSGAGLLTALVPQCGYDIMQTAVPGAMVITDTEHDHLSSLPDDLEKYTSIGIGPGIGQREGTQALLRFVIKRYRGPLILDADALNILAAKKEALKFSPGTVLTPHPKEMERLTGSQPDDFARLQSARDLAKDSKAIIILKGHRSFICLPDGKLLVNSSGNAGMAKGGSGDVLTGILTALCGQQYQLKDAVALGVFLHGKAGDLAATELGMEAMLPTDLTRKLGAAFLSLRALD